MATNEGPETVDHSIDVVLMDTDGIRRGHGSDYIETVRSDETAPGEIITSTTYAEGDSCEVVGVTRSVND